MRKILIAECLVVGRKMKPVQIQTLVFSIVWSIENSAKHWKEVTMATIEERAKAFSEEQNACDICDGKGKYCPCGNFTADYDMYFKIATEQDRIARTEERERCIKSAQEWRCKNECPWFIQDGKCPMGYPCGTMANIRKALEGGEG